MYKLYFKRLIDIFLSSLALIILSPFLMPICIILLFTGENYVFYFQERIGYKNKPFLIYKFATMLKNSPNMGTGLHTKKSDSRVLPFGHFLRKSKINELPQLLNILFGSMSIVGPRPLVDKTFEPYSQFVKKNIYNVKPGLTGIGSIIFRDEEELLSKTNIPLEIFYKNEISPYKGELEIWYQNNVSLYTDIMIIIITACTLFFPNNNLVYKLFKDLPKRNFK
jgi:lipopolysaccharide/colanic/teichoic acid biosynthesis glycosyltransferase